MGSFGIFPNAAFAPGRLRDFPEAKKLCGAVIYAAGKNTVRGASLHGGCNKNSACDSVRVFLHKFALRTSLLTAASHFVAKQRHERVYWLFRGRKNGFW